MLERPIPLFFLRRVVRRISALLLAALFLAAAPSDVHAKRVALVVGIDRYDNLPAHQQLERAVADARTLATTLKELGFDVTAVENTGREGFYSAWTRFLGSVAPGDTAALFYAGHGIEMRGSNYLIPRDAPAAEKGEIVLRNGSLALATLLDDLEERKPGVSLVILDACRNNPFAVSGRSLGGTRGLVRVDERPGTLILYSAGAGQTALDKVPGRPDVANSVFTHTLVPLLKAQGLSLIEVAIRTQREVDELARRAGHTQTPAFYSQLLQDVYLAGAPTAMASDAEAKRKAEEAEIARRVEAELKKRADAGKRMADATPPATKLPEGTPRATPTPSPASDKPDPFEPSMPSPENLERGRAMALSIAAPVQKAQALTAVSNGLARLGRKEGGAALARTAVALFGPEHLKNEHDTQIADAIGALARNGQLDEALKAVDRLSHDNQKEHALARIAEAMILSGGSDDARAVIARMKSPHVKLSPLVALAVALDKAGLKAERDAVLGEARRTFGAIQPATNAGYFAFYLIVGLIRVGQTEEAIALPGTFTAPGARRSAMASLGFALAKSGRQSEAVTAFEAAKAAARAEATSNVLLANLLGSLAASEASAGLADDAARTLAAAEDVAAALSAPHERSSASFQLAVATAALKRYDRALAHARAVGIGRAVAFGAVASAYVRDGRTQEAEALIRSVDDAAGQDTIKFLLAIALAAGS